MRLFAALVYLFAGMWLFFCLFPEGPFGFGLILFFALMFSSVPLFNKGLLRKLKGQTYAQYLAELEHKGRLENVTHHASRAFCFEDLDTGRNACFVDIGDAGILCLHGQYLHQFEPVVAAEPGHAARTRVFPCGEFTLRRLKKGRDIMDIVPQGKAFEPFVIAQPRRQTLRELNIPMHDGDIYTHVKYAELLAACARLNS